MGYRPINIDSRTPQKTHIGDFWMPAIVQYPTVVQQALDRFGDNFQNEPERRHFAEYLTGLLIARKKNVSAINREFAFTTDQSCLNRFVTEVDWDAEALNADRLEWLQQDPKTRYSKSGVIAIDNVLIGHSGKYIEDVGYFWDHAESRSKIAHDYLIINYVCNSGKQYPLEFYRFIKKEKCQKDKIEFQDHNVLFRNQVDWAVGSDIPGDFTFDSWFTHKDNLNHIHGHNRNYVGDLKFNRKILLQGQNIKAEELAQTIDPAIRKLIVIGDHRQYYFTKSIRIPGVDHKVRLLILWKKKNDSDPKKILVCNRCHWEAIRMLKVYRHRWQGTECFHRDGKQNLGMGDCQLRNGLGQTRHMYMVFLAYSVLMSQMQQNRVCEWACERLTTIGQSCMAVLRETFSDTISWAIDKFESEGLSIERIKIQLDLP
jgi:hypothetical protein